METILINNSAFVVSTAMSVKMVGSEGEVGMNGEGTMVDPSLDTGAAKDSLLSSWPFVIGISVAVLLVSVALGTFLAKRKIKKGIELYED